MAPKVSIIVPVYNGEKFIKRTLASILDQCLSSIEVIVINDGSTDRTLEEIATLKDQRLRVISKVNQGVSSARNLGIKEATGAYIGFVDADDRIAKELYEELYNASVEKKVDVVVSGLLIEKNGAFIHKESLLQPNKIYSNADFKNEVLVRYLSVENLDLLSVVNKIYKRSFLLKYSILFDETLALEEDGMFNLAVYTQMDTLLGIPYQGYYYLENASSATRDFVNNDIIDRLVQKFNYDYPESIQQGFSHAEIRSFKSSRLIYSICFILFSLSKYKMSRKDKNKFIDAIMNEPVVLLAAQNLNAHYVRQSSKFERVIASFIKQDRRFMIKALVAVLTIIQKMKLMDLIRKLN